MRFQCSLHLRIHGHCLLRFALSDICHECNEQTVRSSSRSPLIYFWHSTTTTCSVIAMGPNTLSSLVIRYFVLKSHLQFLMTVCKYSRALYLFTALFGCRVQCSIVSLHCALAKLRRSVLQLPLSVCVFVCFWVCYQDNSKLRASILTKLGLQVKVVTISSWLNFGRPAPPERGSAPLRWGEIFGSALLQPARSVCVSSERFIDAFPVSEMTYTVSSETLNSTIPYLWALFPF